MKTLTFYTGKKNETVEIVSLLQIGPERFVATTTEGFEIDLHQSHIIEDVEYTTVRTWFYKGYSNKEIGHSHATEKVAIKNKCLIKFLNHGVEGATSKFQKIKENSRGQFVTYMGTKIYFNF